MSAPYDRLKRFEAALARRLPGFAIKYKDESTLMKIIGAILFFNKTFMTGFITTIGYTVYFPTKSAVEATTGVGKLITLAHEYRHAKDASKLTRALFGALYLLPQLLAPFMFLFCFLYWWLGLALFALFLAPLPAYFRMRFERSGYIMSLFVKNELLKEVGIRLEDRLKSLKITAKKKNAQFTGANYYFMWPFGVEGDLLKAAEKIVSGQILKEDDIYNEISTALQESK